MKYSSLVVVLIVVLVLPTLADEIVSGHYPGNLTTTLCPNPGEITDSEHGIWDNGTYYADVEFGGGCPAVGIAFIDVMSGISGQVALPSACGTSWTVQGTAGGIYRYRDGSTTIDYFFSGPATYDLYLNCSGPFPTLSFTMGFTASAPSPIPEPCSALLAATGLAAILQKRRSKLLAR